MKAENLWKRRAGLFFVSQCITLFGSQIVQMAIVWYVTLHTRSGAWVAAFSLCSYLPQFFVSFLGGVWADRFSRKALIIGADMLIAAVTLGTMLVEPHISSESGLLTVLLTMSVIRSAGAGIQNPAVNAVIPQLVPQDQLVRCNGINAAMQSFVQFAAPAGAAAILMASTLRTALGLDLITAALGIGLLACMKLSKHEGEKAEGCLLSQIGEGVHYAFVSPVIRKTLMIYGLFLFLTVPAGYLSGLLVSRVYGDTYWHLTAVELVGFGGMAAGGLLMSLWGGFSSRRLVLSAGLLAFGTMAIAMGVSTYFTMYLVFMAMYGVALTMVQTTITTMLQEHAQADMHGRIFGLMSALYAGCYPLGMAIFGPLADRVPLRGIMVFSGAALALLAAAAFCDADLRKPAG